MTTKQIKNFNDFCQALLQTGFSTGGGNSEGIFAVIPWSWDTNPPYETPVVWHTGDPETDPWEWRMRVLDEREDIAYSKLFVNKSGYITKDWYPYFLAVRRSGKTFEQAYQDGTVSHIAKRIYQLISEHGVLPLHEIKNLGGFGKEDKSKFDRAITELQMKMFITMCGRQQKISQSGHAYSWASTAFCTVESFFPASVFKQADEISPEQAYEKILQQIYALNPDAAAKKADKFIKG